MKKYQITEKQVRQFNTMLATLRKIDKGYMTVQQIQKDAVHTIEYKEYLEMTYENVKEEAKHASKGIRYIESKPDDEPGTVVLFKY